jgi:cytochrome c553
LRPRYRDNHRPRARRRRDAGSGESRQGRIRAVTRHFVLAASAAVLLGASSCKIHAAGDLALGQYLSSECVTCHQVSGRFDGIPPIVGWPEASFIEIMMQYRTKERTNLLMQTIAGKLTEEEIAALAAYFGSLKPTPRAK